MTKKEIVLEMLRNIISDIESDQVNPDAVFVALRIASEGNPSVAVDHQWNLPDGAWVVCAAIREEETVQ